MSGSQLILNDVRCRFGGRTVLDLSHLSAQGGLITLLGPNGAGKTTLLRLVATVTQRTEGEVLIDGLDPRHESDRLEARRRLGYLPQHVGFHRAASVFDAVEYVAVLRGVRDERARRFEVAERLREVGLADRLADPADELSGGMRQRVGLAQALLGDPSLLLLDEPSAGLDPDERQRLREIITARRRDATIVTSTHHVDEAAIADRIIVLADGRIAFDDTPTKLRALASGRAWLQSDPPLAARASWAQADGTWRCLGDPPAGASIVDPTLEDGYLLALDLVTAPT